MKPALPPHSVQWYERLANMQAGYFYPWKSQLAPWHGEDNFRLLVRDHLRPELEVLEIACAQGELALAMAPHCRSVLAYDVTPGFIDLALQARAERNQTNVTFLVHDSSAAANNGQPHLPAADHSIDLFVNSKGPFHWIAEAPRIGRPGAALLMLVPDNTPSQAWETRLPEPLCHWSDQDPNWARTAIEEKLSSAGLQLHSWWSYDVPEVFKQPEDLYTSRIFGFTPEEVPTLQQVAPILQQIFNEFGSPQGLELRWRRHIWKAILP